ncbi:MAG: sulfurtransferase [Candidatus Korobacteraceae bacterium]
MKRSLPCFAILAVYCAAAFSLAWAANPADTKLATGTSAANPNLLVSTQWLADHLSDPHLVIVHIGHDHGEYLAVHIPGARFLPMDKFVSSQAQDPGAELLPPDQLKKNLEAVGISDDSRVVYYAPDWDPMATRLFFTLDYLGHGDQAALLDGGMDRWLSEKRPTSNEEPKITPGTLTIHLHPEIVAKMDWMTKLVAEQSGSSDVVIIDARPAKRYRAGHLPGAEPMFWEKALVSQDNPVLLSPEELKQKLTALGVTPDKKVVSYCEVGFQATYTYFVARYLGYKAAMYDGSYNEWSEAKQPVVRGDSPR